MECALITFYFNRPDTVLEFGGGKRGKKGQKRRKKALFIAKWMGKEALL